MTNLTDDQEERGNNHEKPASELDDESLFDRLFPDEVIQWVKDRFREDEPDEE